ncbi:MAG: AAA family ATPase [Lachnospiraceae bacterium]|jgi:predicted AAA+ superfamily ATPase|nr:AAA family ATPase [Lachnospiraceae bacterium]
MYKRKIYEKMLAWKQENAGRYALMIEGARRVGKSTIVKKFAENEYDSYIMINFAEVSETVTRLFNDLSDVDYIFLQLQLQYNTSLHKRKSVIIFDEVQLCPKARQAIKTLVGDGRYDYIETGSLISIKKNVQGIVIPSEEKKLSMYPMDYEEFKWALGDTATIPLLRQTYEKRQSLGDGTNQKLIRDFRLYMLVGGMPQAITAYLETNDLKKVDDVKREIISLYEEDFGKIDPSGYLTQLFDSIPAELNKNRSRYISSRVIGRRRKETVRELISRMKESRTVLVSYHSNDPNTGMSATRDLDRYKLYVADTGLFVTLAFKDRDFTDNTLYSKLLSDKLSANLGYLYENIVAQMLTADGDELFYYTISDEEKKKVYEVDFIVQRKSKICPIEVKSSSYRAHASFDEFIKKYSERIADKYIIYTKDLKTEENILYLPVYMTMMI